MKVYGEMADRQFSDILKTAFTYSNIDEFKESDYSEKPLSNSSSVLLSQSLNDTDTKLEATLNNFRTGLHTSDRGDIHEPHPLSDEIIADRAHLLSDKTLQNNVSQN